MMEEDLDAKIIKKEKPNQKYIKNGEDQVKRFTDILGEEGIKAPEVTEKAGIPRSTAYELLKEWNNGDGTVYPKGCRKRESKKKAAKLPGNTKLQEQRTAYLIELVDDNPCITVQVAKEELYLKFSNLSISKSGLSKHMKANCGLSLKYAQLYNLERDTARTLSLRFDVITQWKEAEWTV
jgi:transposase